MNVVPDGSHATSIKLPSAYGSRLSFSELRVKKTPVLKREELYQGLIDYERYL
jgi:hypothetical protein